MTVTKSCDVTVVLPATPALVPALTALVERSMLAFGAAPDEALGVVLAVEEIASYVATAAPSSVVEVLCHDDVWSVVVALTIPSRDFDLRALNLVPSFAPTAEEHLDELGLLLAARSVDRLTLEAAGSGALCLRVIKDKSYPAAMAVASTAKPASGAAEVGAPTAEEVKAVARFLAGYPFPVPAGWRHPGRLHDMVTAGAVDVLVARDAEGRIGGAVLWRRRSTRVVEWFGPHVFSPDVEPTTANELVDAFLAAVARTDATGVIRLYPGPRPAVGAFEELGVIDFEPESGQVGEVALYRELDADEGACVWAHPELVDYLRREHARLVLPREIMPARAEGERLPAHSVLAADVERDLRLVTLRPLWSGADFAENLDRHVAALAREGITSALLELDLGHAWHGALGGAAVAAGFEPRLVIPHGGLADVLVLQHVHP